MNPSSHRILSAAPKGGVAAEAFLPFSLTSSVSHSSLRGVASRTSTPFWVVSVNFCNSVIR